MSAVPSCRSVAGNSVEWGTSRLETGKTTERWQDKRGSPVVIQAIEMACLSACLSVGSRAAIEEFSINFNGVSGTVGRRLRLAARPCARAIAIFAFGQGASAATERDRRSGVAGKQV